MDSLIRRTIITGPVSVARQPGPANGECFTSPVGGICALVKMHGRSLITWQFKPIQFFFLTAQEAIPVVARQRQGTTLNYNCLS